jgi:hypothetical protein
MILQSHSLSQEDFENQWLRFCSIFVARKLGGLVFKTIVSCLNNLCFYGNEMPNLLKFIVFQMFCKKSVTNETIHGLLIQRILNDMNNFNSIYAEGVNWIITIA